MPTNCCVGDGGPTPQQVAAGFGGSAKSRVGAREPVTPSNKNIRISSGLGNTAEAKAFGSRSASKGRAQRKQEKWVPGSGSFSSVPVGYDGPLGCAGGDYNKNLDGREA